MISIWSAWVATPFFTWPHARIAEINRTAFLEATTSYSPQTCLLQFPKLRIWTNNAKFSKPGGQLERGAYLTTRILRGPGILVFPFLFSRK